MDTRISLQKTCSAIYLRQGRQRPALKRIALAWFGCILTIASFSLGCQRAMAQSTAPAYEDHQHSAWSALLERCVVPVNDGNSTAADYDCFSDREAALDSYLASLASVDKADFQRWESAEQLAFLINAYNAWTVKLILSAWPDIESIRDLGNFLFTPWKKDIVTLFGTEMSLDDIEHGTIRDPGRFDEPRIHFAVNCASIGCPALRQEAFVAERLDAQLEEQTHSFLADESRNRVTKDGLQISSIFDWYRGDFEQGWRNADTLEEFLALYADALKLGPDAEAQLRAGTLTVDFLDYDWALNKLP